MEFVCAKTDCFFCRERETQRRPKADVCDLRASTQSNLPPPTQGETKLHDDSDSDGGTTVTVARTCWTCWRFDRACWYLFSLDSSLNLACSTCALNKRSRGEEYENTVSCGNVRRRSDCLPIVQPGFGPKACKVVSGSWKLALRGLQPPPCQNSYRTPWKNALA